MKVAHLTIEDITNLKAIAYEGKEHIYCDIINESGNDCSKCVLNKADRLAVKKSLHNDCMSHAKLVLSAYNKYVHKKIEKILLESK